MKTRQVVSPNRSGLTIEYANLMRKQSPAFYNKLHFLTFLLHKVASDRARGLKYCQYTPMVISIVVPYERGNFEL